VLTWSEGSHIVSKPPVWLIEFTIKPRFTADVGRVVDVLARMVSEGIHVGYSKEAEGGGLIAKVIDEQHLDMVVEILTRTHKIELKAGAPRVAYRETLARAVEVDYTHKKQAGGTGQFARVKLRLEPNAAGAGNEFQSEIVGGVVPKEYIPGVAKGVQSVWDSGVQISFPLLDTRVTLFDGAYHVVDSSVIAFETAAREAMRKGAVRAGIKLMEPIMDVEVLSPSNFAGNVVADLNNRRGHIRSQEMRGNATMFRANAPLGRLFGYKRRLSSITNGLGTFTMSFSHYAEVPRGNGPDDFPPAVGMRRA
jgi:elongation factor G